MKNSKMRLSRYLHTEALTNQLFRQKAFLKSFLARHMSWIGKISGALVEQSVFAGSNFVIDIILARIMSTDAFGAYVVVDSWFVLCQNLYDAYLTEPMAIFGSGKYGSSFKGYLAYTYIGHLGISLIVALVLGIAAHLTLIFDSTLISSAMLGVAIASPLLLTRWLARQPFYILGKPHWSALGNLLYFGICLVGIFGLEHFQMLTPFSVFIMLGLASLCYSAVLTIFLLKPNWNFKGSSLSPRQILRDHWNYGKWASGTKVANWIPSNIFYIVLPAILGLGATAALRGMNYLIMPLNMGVAAAMGILLPTFSRTFTNSGKASLNRQVRVVLTIFLGMAGLYCLIVTVFGQMIVNLLYNGRFDSYVTVPILLTMGLAPLIVSANVVLDAALRAMGNVKQSFLSTLVPAGLILTVGIWLLSRYGLLGANISQLVIGFIATVTLASFYRRASSTVPAKRQSVTRKITAILTVPRSLSLKYMAVIGLCLVIVGLPGYLYVRSSLYDMAVRNAEANLTQIGTRQALAIQQDLEQARSALHNFAADENNTPLLTHFLHPAADSRPINANEIVDLVRSSLLEPAAAFDSVYLLDQNGQTVLAVAPDSTSFAHSDETQSSAFHALRDAQADHQSSAIAISQAGSQSVEIIDTISAPDGTPTGYVIATLNNQVVFFNNLSSLAAASSSFLTTATGQLLAPATMPALANQSVGLSQILNRDNTNSINTYSYTANDGSHNVGFTMPIDNTPFVFVAQAPIDGIYADSATAVLNIVVLVFVGLVALLTLLITRLTVPPIIRLGKSLRAIATGNYAVEVSDIGRHDEIGLLAAALVDVRNRQAETGGGAAPSPLPTDAARLKMGKHPQWLDYRRRSKWTRSSPDALPLTPLISVVMPAYNAEKYIAQAVESIVNQTFKRFELIIVDDGSTDKTLQMVRHYAARDQRIRLVCGDHGGAAAALNRGLNAAQCDWVAIMHSDDIALPTRLAVQWEAAQSDPEVVIWGTDGYHISQSGRILSCFRVGPTSKEECDLLRKEGSIVQAIHPTVMLNREVALRVGGYNPKFQVCEDIDLFDRMMNYGALVTIQQQLLQYRVHGNSLSMTKYLSQGVLARYVAARQKNRLATGTELTYDAFMVAYHRDRLLTRWQHRLSDITGMYYRRAALAYSNKQYAQLVINFGIASLLNPSYTLRRVWLQMLSPRTRNVLHTRRKQMAHEDAAQ